MTVYPASPDPDQLAGENLPAMPMWPEEMMPRPLASNRNAVWFAGTQLTTMIYEADDGVVEFDDLPYDEHVHIINGQAIQPPRS